ncbi:hypothetical protein TRIUR3_31648 [Triticum urartu]|uniref:Uncharacterized protein n=1 Tax=Triticum urartu TaxID=4572 RepID=M7ZJ16_TRIUA|nr:hypothetical protein TRIUR3_31648 [Triticum urartu]
MAAKNSKGQWKRKPKKKNIWAMCLGKCDVLGDLATALKRWQGCCTHPCTQRRGVGKPRLGSADRSYAVIDRRSER